MTKRPDEVLMGSKGIDAGKVGISLSPEQLVELERCLGDEEPFATEEEVHAVFDRLTK